MRTAALTVHLPPATLGNSRGAARKHASQRQPCGAGAVFSPEGSRGAGAHTGHSAPREQFRHGATTLRTLHIPSTRVAGRSFLSPRDARLPGEPPVVFGGRMGSLGCFRTAQFQSRVLYGSTRLGMRFLFCRGGLPRLDLGAARGRFTGVSARSPFPRPLGDCSLPSHRLAGSVFSGESSLVVAARSRAVKQHFQVFPFWHKRLLDSILAIAWTAFRVFSLHPP